VPYIGGVVANILGYVAAFVAGAMIVVALKAMFETAR
jgi:zinc transporter ZupT